MTKSGRKNGKKRFGKTLVLTPAGESPAAQVHRVNPGETITRTESGDYRIEAHESPPSQSREEERSLMASKLVLTPGGYKPAELVHHVPLDQLVHMRGEIAEIHHRTHGFVRAIGRITRRAGPNPLLPLNISRLKPEGSAHVARPSEKGAFAEVDGWVSYTGWTNSTGKPISKLSTSWKVPPEPANRGAQTVFLFNGIQNSTMIYQPVLQWGPSAAGGGQKWSVACWYADGQDGHSFYSTLADVAAGDVLTGLMTLTAQSGNLFSYSAEFVGIPATVLPISNVDELTWANETLEAYGITSRDDFPNAADTDLGSIELQAGGISPSLTWVPESAHPESGSHVQVVSNSATAGEVRIWYVQQ
jgi:hypothetical protein